MFVAIAHGALTKESPSFRVIAELDRDRRAVGLDHVLSPEQVMGLERCARRWERIENALSSALWRSQSELSGRIDRTAFDCMLWLVAYTQGAPGTQTEARARAERLSAISRAMDKMAAALESYYRPEEVAAGAPAEGFAEVAGLERLLGASGAEEDFLEGESGGD